MIVVLHKVALMMLGRFARTQLATNAKAAVNHGCCFSRETNEQANERGPWLTEKCVPIRERKFLCVEIIMLTLKKSGPNSSKKTTKTIWSLEGDNNTVLICRVLSSVKSFLQARECPCEGKLKFKSSTVQFYRINLSNVNRNTNL